MSICDIVNDYGRKYSPYLGDLLNHLPMTQIALYRLTNDVDRVMEYTRAYEKDKNLEVVKKEYKEVSSFLECLGKRDLYEGCAEYAFNQIKEKGVEETVRHVLSTYPLGISSSIFHSILRVAYAVNAYTIDKCLDEEVARALAYYVTSYREGKLFTREIKGVDLIDEMKGLLDQPRIKKIRESNTSMGQKLKVLYSDEDYLASGFIIEGSEEDKVRFLLNMVIPAYYNSMDVVTLHCITGLHAVVSLKDYFKDLNKVWDILTTAIITHLLTVENLDFEVGRPWLLDFSWTNLIKMGAESTDDHVIKLTYSCSELSKHYDTIGLKKAIKKRLFG